jgi:CheY-like chemotaxis protein
MAYANLLRRRDAILRGTEAGSVRGCSLRQGVSIRPGRAQVWESADALQQGYTTRMTHAPAPIKVLVAEDNRDLADAMCELLRGEPDIDVVAVVDDASSLLEAVRGHGPRVVILDLNLASGSSVPAMQAARHERPVGIVVYSGYDRADVAAALPPLGPCEFVSKTGEVADLVAAVRRAADANAAGTDR